jgi:hypothetical protein
MNESQPVSEALKGSTKSKSFKGKNKALVEGLGEGGQSGLEKLNEMMEQELSNLNHLKKLFQYL